MKDISPKTESDLLKLIQMKASDSGSRLFRNNTGLAYMGQPVKITQRGFCPVEQGDVVVRQARPVHFGLCVGGGDLIGWTPVKITSEMIGRTLAVFTNIEGKDPSGRGKVRPEQQNMHEQVVKAGGLSGIVKSVADYLAAVSRNFSG